MEIRGPTGAQSYTNRPNAGEGRLLWVARQRCLHCLDREMFAARSPAPSRHFLGVIAQGIVWRNNKRDINVRFLD
jgi:hypothetical protein